MKERIVLFALLLATSFGFAQTVNDYKAAIVPTKFDFLKYENQYRLATLTKHNLQKAGFVVFYSNEELPAEYHGQRCSLLNVEVVRDNAFLTTKLYVVMKDCYGKVVYTSETGKSKIKEYEPAYKEALDGAFESVYKLNYQYNGKTVVEEGVKQAVVSTPVAVAPTSVVQTATTVAVSPMSSAVSTNANTEVLYAQPTETGYQLIDKTPKVVMKLMKTSQDNMFMAIRDGVQGSLLFKSNNWYFEYYKDDKLVSELILVKF